MSNTKKELAASMSAKLQKTIDKHNQRVAENFGLYSEECKRQGKKVGEPIDIMEMLKHETEKT